MKIKRGGRNKRLMDWAKKKSLCSFSFEINPRRRKEAYLGTELAINLTNF